MAAFLVQKHNGVGPKRRDLLHVRRLTPFPSNTRSLRLLLYSVGLTLTFFLHFLNQKLLKRPFCSRSWVDRAFSTLYGTCSTTVVSVPNRQALQPLKPKTKRTPVSCFNLSCARFVLEAVARNRGINIQLTPSSLFLPSHFVSPSIGILNPFLAWQYHSK